MKLLLVFVFASLTSCSTIAQETATIFLVRHAEKEDQSRDARLSLAGKVRAYRLMELLQGVDFDAIYSTNYRRTEMTVSPIALEQKVQISYYRPFEDDLRAELRQKYQGKTVLVVGHSNTIPDLVNDLIGKDLYTQLDDNDYSKIFVVTLHSEDAAHHILTY